MELVLLVIGLDAGKDPAVSKPAVEVLPVVAFGVINDRRLSDAVGHVGAGLTLSETVRALPCEVVSIGLVDAASAPKQATLLAAVRCVESAADKRVSLPGLA